MPLKFLQSIKAKHEKSKNKSKSTTDLLHGRKEQCAQSAQMIPTEAGFKQKSQSRPYLRYNNKESTQVPSKKIKDFRHKSCADLAELKKIRDFRHKSCADLTELKVSDAKTGKSDSEHDLPQSTGQSGCDQNGNEVPASTGKTNRSASCFALIDSTSRERRLSDIALLDQYINYHQRRAATDDGTNTNRLVCAQLLRESFLRLEQTNLADMLRSHSKQELSRSVSNLNQIPASLPRQPQFQKHNQRRLSSVVGLSQLCEPRRSLASVTSDDRDEDGPIQFSCKADADTVFTETDYDSKTKATSATENFHFRDLFRKNKSIPKRKSVPVFAPQEIEIF